MSETRMNVGTLTWPASSSFGRRPWDASFERGSAFVDGRIVPVEEASVPLLDWGFLRSDACQETISVWNGQFFRLDDHLQRFERSITRLRMTSSPVSRDEIRSIAHRLVAACGYDKAYVQIIMTRGRPSDRKSRPAPLRQSLPGVLHSVCMACVAGGSADRDPPPCECTRSCSTELGRSDGQALSLARLPDGPAGRV